MLAQNPAAEIWRIADGDDIQRAAAHAPPSVIPSSIRRQAQLNRALLETGRQHGVHDQGARTRPALVVAGATAPGHAVNMLRQRSADILMQHPCSST